MGESEHAKRLPVSKTEEQPYSDVPSEECDEKREKPWQRVPNLFIVLLLGVYLLLGYLTQLVEDDMPKVVPEASIARDDWQSFSEESALRHLHGILGGEPRVAGTKFHLKKTIDLYNMVDSIASQSTLPIHTDWQFVTGDLNLSALFVNYYQNASNIIAVLEGESGFNTDETTRSSLLVNCHYDSVPFAQGASDNGVFCAAMMETLSRLSRRKQKFKHNIVFLFNGAEENPLQAAHGFLKHRWARGVTAVINLDSAGMNGKPSVFQATDPRILSSYRRHTGQPSAQGVGEFLFQTGIIPSDTDFRIFRDFGGIHGIDIAFTKWGHVYHTRNDRPELILPGVIQNAGNMLLNLVANAADRDDLTEKATRKTEVYFDYLNLFMVTYTYQMSHLLDIFVGLFAYLSVLYYVWLVGKLKSTKTDLLLSLLGRFLCLLGGALPLLVLVPIMVATTVQMRYLTQPWIVVPMFWIPYVMGTIVVSHLYDADIMETGLNRSMRTLQAQAATRLALGTVLVIMALIPQVTSVRYIVALPLFVMSLAAFISLTVVRYLRMTAWQHLILDVITTAPGVIFIMMISLRLCAIMLPVMGRSGGALPDYVVGLLNVGMAVLACMVVSGTELLFSRRRLWLPISLIMSACLVCMFVPFSPYHEDGIVTQRHYWMHSETITYNENKEVTSRVSGVVVTKHDPYTITDVRNFLADNNIRVNTRDNFTEDCEKKVYCDLPLYRVAFGNNLPSALFLYTAPPAAFTPAPDATLTNRTCVNENCTYDFELTVAPHNLITIRPNADVELQSWSFSSPVASSLLVGGRPVYVIMHSVATYSEDYSFKFSLNLKVPPHLQNKPVLELSLHAHLAAHPEAFTKEYSSLLDKAPKYFNIATFLSRRNNYVF